MPDTLAGRRVVCADVAALDNILIYNRFGSYNPFGMIFALRRDLVPVDTSPIATTAAECAADDGTEKDIVALAPGEVRLRDCKRPRPMVLRANVRDLLVVGVENLLRPEVPGHSENFCRPGALTTDPLTAEVRGALSEGDDGAVARGEAACRTGTASQEPGIADPADGEWPRTRLLNFAIQGLIAIPDPNAIDSAQANADLRVCRGLTAIPPGAHVTCFYQVDAAEPYFLSSNAAPAGGEGDGGSITHGLFGAVVVQDPGTSWYRSQVSQAAMDRAWVPVEADPSIRMRTGDHRRSGAVDYEAASNDMPVLNIVKSREGKALEIVHSDLNAIVSRPGGPSFREFSVFFHDELKTFYTKNFEELGKFGQLAGARDGFAINYGASGMGALLLANRKGIGPASDCVECLYEEFFLTSWANGDPALLERYSDDPSNVHHSYLNDEVRFRNFHAGPKETHVFHLHAHQWFSGDDRNRGTYLDSQTVAPQQSFSYRIYGGGLDNYGGSPDNPWLAEVGSGNRNRGIGDSIFHCHLYPHFAQGMWELWRVHDVIEDGTRKLPDGQADAKLSTEARALPPDSAAIKHGKRIGSVDPENGRWIAAAEGTPVPALVPLPGKPLPVLPTYADASADPYLTAEAEAAMPGYPFYIAGAAGHRPPQAPMDIARALRNETTATDPVAADEYLDAGLPRHTVLEGERKFAVTSPPGTPPAQQIAKALAMGDMTAHLESARLRLLDYEGTALERAAMGFHFDGKRWGDATPIAVKRSDGSPAAYNPLGGYEVGSDGATPSIFTVNGSAPKPGAPFADPCGAPGAISPAALRRDPLINWNIAADFRPDPGVASFRRYEASAVQLDLITNRAGWHDPQARINVLTARSDGYKDANTPLGADAISPFISAREEPFFFRAFSTECIEFRHTNELPKELELDDFQVRTPTDTIGQHIHLVKFDVTASDGSGNGFNYEDGTLAADEIAARICAAKTEDEASVTSSRAPRTLAVREAAGLCEKTTVDGREVWVPSRKDIWRLKRGEHPALFQTTVQRWFADPILSRTGDDDATADRTLRTVFSHDHFGPSSIQQHGFYTALIVEPAENSICHPDLTDCRQIANLDTVSDGDEVTVGVHRVLTAADAATGVPSPGPSLGETLHPDTREYALAVADFAILYDPRDSDVSIDAIIATGETKGLARLACEARNRNNPSQLESLCGSKLATVDGVVTDAAEDAVPAWNAAGRPDGVGSGIDAMTTADAQQIASHLEDYRTRAALSTGSKLAKPVAAPARPESISVDHHDPFLVNYRGEPMPLRLASKDRSNTRDCALMQMPMPGTPPGAGSDADLVTDAGNCSHALQRSGEEGEVSNVFLSSLHGDPATPLIETFAGERTLIRLIQGAQEVQHVFNIEGYSFRRNLDQAFSRAAPAVTGGEATQKQRCDALAAVTGGYPLHYREWFEGRLSGAVAAPVAAFFKGLEFAAAHCLNVEGNVAAQEIGISEHFEFAGVFQQTFQSGTLRAISPGSAAPATAVAPSAPDRRRFSTDYLWSFGTQDALWNGAWGLVRVYLDPEAPDLTTCMRAAPDGDPAACLTQASIGGRLSPLPLRGLGGAVLGAARATATPPEALALACKPDAPRAEAAVAAIEARRIFGADGLTLGRTSYDPDALLLLALEPDGLDTRLAAPNARALLEQELKTRYAKDPVEPYVLPVRAGECVTLTIVNLLSATLPDDFGDARMPAITPLNTTPAQSLVGAAQGSQPQINALDMQAGQSWRNGLTPSSRLALRFPLPVMNENQSIALPFGYNATAALMPSGAALTLADGNATPGRGGFVRREATVERVTFYAGKVSAKTVESTKLENDVAVALAARLRNAAAPPDIMALAALLDIDNLVLVPLDREDFRPGAISFSGRQYELAPLPALTETQRDRLTALVNEEAAAVLSGPDYAHWIPYAFVALPIEPFGDVIGQPSHGMVGAVLVLPVDAAMEGADPVSSSGRRIVHPRATPAGQAVAYQQAKICEGGVCPSPEMIKARNFVLFYQDGLNLWDKGSRIRWTRKDGSKVVASDRLKMQPDCAICDDSYDLGDRALSYHAAPLHDRMRSGSSTRLEADSNLNAVAFPSGFWLLRDGEVAAGPAGVGPPKSATSMPVLRARAGEEVVISVLEPGGRARQHAVVTIAQNYDDLFPGFGFPHSALMAPGKGLNASLSAPVKVGCYLIHDGPTYLRADGIWALLDVVEPEDYGDAGKTQCKLRP